MSSEQTPTVTPASAPKIGFVSLGCPKALTDSELILTQLRAEGYETSKTFAGADLVIVNTCGFIDDAVKESLDSEVLDALGRGAPSRGSKVWCERDHHVVRVAHPLVVGHRLACGIGRCDWHRHQLAGL